MTTNNDGYEVFRRAVVERDAEAWALIAADYRPLMVSWARRCVAAETIGVRHEDLADEALARAWVALSPERFAGFPSLAALLSYLRACVNATAIDAARARSVYDRLAEQIAGSDDTTPEQLVVAQSERDALWQLVLSLSASEAERVVLTERFLYDLPPRAIQSRHPQLFPQVTVIYAVLRNLCDRLRRNKGLRELYAEHIAA